jgi:hypothetical protein
VLTVTNIAIDQLKERANKGDGEACFELYQEFKNGANVKADEDEALDWLEKAIDHDHPIAQLIMGLSYLNAGKVKDAIDYLDLSCKNNNLDAMNILGQLYMGNVSGVEDVPLDKNSGIELLSKAAAGGNVYAQLTLGKCYMNADGVHKDKFMASLWLEKAAAQNNIEAAMLLDECNTLCTLMN